MGKEEVRGVCILKGVMWQLCLEDSINQSVRGGEIMWRTLEVKKASVSILGEDMFSREVFLIFIFQGDFWWEKKEIERKVLGFERRAPSQFLGKDHTTNLEEKKEKGRITMK